MTRASISLLLLLSVSGLPAASFAQSGPAARTAGPLPENATGEQIYRAACITCHGEDGAGGAKEALGNVSPPDFVTATIWPPVVEPYCAS